MSLPNLVPRGNLTGSIGTTTKKWATGSFGTIIADGSNLTGVVKTTGGSITGSLIISSSIHNAPLSVQEITFDTAYSNTGTFVHETGRIYWDSTNGGLTVDMLGDSASLQVGQEIYIYARNNTGETILNGQAVRLSGATGNKVTVEKAIAQPNLDGSDLNDIIGIATENIDTNESGYITTFGTVRDIDTSAFSEGALVYLSYTTSGSYTSVRPPAPYDITTLGVIERSHATLGQLFVSITTPTHMHDITGITGSVNVPAGYSLMKDPTGANTYTFSNRYTGSFSGSFVGDGSDLVNINVAATPQGPDTSIQFRNTSATSGSSNFTFDKTTNTVRLSGSFFLSGSLRRKTTRITSSTYTLTPTDYRIGVSWTLSSSVDLQLPLISDVGEIEFKIKDEHGNASLNNIHLLSSGSDLIDGQVSQSIATNYMSVGLYNDGSSRWFIE